MSACFPVRKVCSSVTGFRVSRAFQVPGAVNEAGSDNVPHVFAQHVLPPQAGDLLIGAVDQDRLACPSVM